MAHAMTSPLPGRRYEADGLRRTMTWSFAIHVAVVVILFVVPRDWLAREKTEPLTMTLQMGSPGERTGGMTAAGGQQIQEVAPPPPRPTPTPIAPPPKAPPIAVVPKPQTKPPVKTDTSAVATAPPRAPTTGAQKQTGTSVAATGARGAGEGLSLGGGAGGTAQVDATFCCPEYGEEITRRIMAKWQLMQNQPETGTNVVIFEIRRDGSIEAPRIFKSSGSEILDIASIATFRDLKLLPLPDRYLGDRLIVRFTLEYKR